MQNERVVLRRQPTGVPTVDDFALEATSEPQAGGVPCETLYISVDPYLRARLSGRHLSGAIAPGDAMSSELVLRVAAAGEGFEGGELVRGMGPWQRRCRLAAEDLTPISPLIEAPSMALGVRGMPGLTAFAGIERLLRPKPGETLLVSAASGPVGATVGQLGRLAGARVIGVAGTDEKCRWLTQRARFDAAINYRRETLRPALDAACPDGIDLYFDNVGGDMLQAAMERLRVGARVALCGLMAQYNAAAAPPGPNPALVIRARATLRGLVVYDHEDLRPRMEAELGSLIRKGSLAYKEDVNRGLEHAAGAFCRLMGGANFGKTLVRL